MAPARYRLDQTILPVTGTYTLVLDPAGATRGTATLKLFTVTNVTGPIAADGTGLPVSLTTPGQNAVLTFSGTAGQAVSVWTSSSAFSIGWGTLSLAIKEPNGTTLTSAVNTRVECFGTSEPSNWSGQSIRRTSGLWMVSVAPSSHF
jgi:hypothetical protein